MSKQLFGNLNADEAKAAEVKRIVIRELKPEGLYSVKVDSFAYDADNDRTPSLVFQLRIVGMLEDDGETFRKNGQGTPRFGNACLFYVAYISNAALFGLQRIYLAQTGERLELEDLVDILSEFTTEAQLKRWVNTWLDKASVYTVSVRQDLKCQKPRNTVSFI